MTDDALMPPEVLPLDAVRPDRAFRVEAETAFLWFEPRGPVLMVSFDNLATVDEPMPRAPWLGRHAAALGWSVLGLQSHAKDWYRQDRPGEMLDHLREAGFFDGFDTILFVGASMGGFAALTLAPRVPGARVLALSPQSTMNRDIAPFEGRFRWAVRNSDWSRPDGLDAARAVPAIPAVTLAYDPFVPEDRAHALRLSGPNVQHVKLRHATHEAVRVVLKAGAMGVMLDEMARDGRLGAGFFEAMRGRRVVRKWARAFLDAVAARHDKLALVAAEALLMQDDYLFAHRARAAVLERRPDLARYIERA